MIKSSYLRGQRGQELLTLALFIFIACAAQLHPIERYGSAHHMIWEAKAVHER